MSNQFLAEPSAQQSVSNGLTLFLIKIIYKKRGGGARRGRFEKSSREVGQVGQPWLCCLTC